MILVTGASGFVGNHVARALIKRGERVDENAPGSGLGLSIVDELARAYGGALMLEESPLGGLLVRLELPRAAA